MFLTALRQLTTALGQLRCRRIAVEVDRLMYTGTYFAHLCTSYMRPNMFRSEVETDGRESWSDRLPTA